jgi:hypothetical protein
MPFALRLLLTAFTLAVTSDPALTVQAETALPRYAFTPGQELTYRIDWSNTTKAKNRTLSDVDRHDIKIWVERQNADGSFHLIFSRRHCRYANP